MGQIQGFEKLAAEAAAESIVLLKNEDMVLPIRSGERVSIFGRPQIEYYRTGTGSGGAVKVEYTSNILEGFKRHKEVILNEELAEIYTEWIKENPFDNGGGGWAAEPWFQKDMPLTRELVERAKEKSEKAIYVIGRTAGEDRDNEEKQGSYLLTEQEEENLKQITEIFEQVIVVLNVSNLIDMSFAANLHNADHIKAVMYIWQGGMEGGNAAADVLTGKESPSGKLPDTIAAAYSDYPSSKNYGGEDRNFYQEDIYIGYRYFETFCPQKVMYEFGFGLSYTQFDISVIDAKVIHEHIRISVLVKNIGNTYAGKEVVQVYYEAPQGTLGRPAKVLAAFSKTPVLQPEEEVRLELSFSVSDMAAYDDGGYTGNKSCYVLEAGDYGIYIGNSVRNVCKVQIEDKEVYRVEKTYVVSGLEEAMAPCRAFLRMKPGKRASDGSYEITYEEVPLRTVSIADRIEQRLPVSISQTGNKGYTLQDVGSGKVSMEEFIAQLTTQELATMVRGEGMGHPDVTPGTASAFGGISDSLKKYGLPLACTADGPSGIRMENGETAVQLPIGTALSSTWNPSLVRELYTCEGKELAANEIDTLLGPGINIHRDPMNGRNFEYYSEDPYLSGRMAAAVSEGINAGGAYATLKHFACNNQEKRRSFVDAVVSERAIREIYLKSFEMAVRFGGAVSIMTSYNPVNGYFAASNYDLNTTILRKEWGFTGLVMTDWWAKMNDAAEGGEGTVQKVRDMIRAQNDVYMVVTNYGAELNANNDDTVESIENGRLTLGELQRCAMNICSFLLKTQSFTRVGTGKIEIPLIEPLKDIAALTADKLQEISDNPTVNIRMGEEVYIKLSDPGQYSLLVHIMSVDSNMYQNTSKIMMNGQPAAFIQTQGTDGKWITQKLRKVELKEGIYCIRPEVVKPHMEIQWIEFKS